MKYTYIKKSLMLLAFGGLIFSCTPDTEINLAKSVTAPTGDAVALATAATSYVVNENTLGAETYKIPVTATLPKVQSIDAVIYLVKQSGTATNTDFTLPTLTIPAGSLSASGNIEILKSGDIEADETLIITAKARDNFKVNFSPVTVQIKDDYVNDHLVFEMGWKGSYTYSVAGGSTSVTVDYCKIDLDLMLYTAAGAYVKYIAGTAACIEKGSVSGLADGKYLIVVDVYENPFAAFNTNQPLPLTVNVSQEHFSANDISYVYGGLNTNISSGKKVIAEIEVKDGYKYTVTPK
jgi:hypothetical protein